MSWGQPGNEDDDDGDPDDPRRAMRRWLGDFLPDDIFRAVEEMMNRMFEDMREGRLLEPGRMDDIVRDPRGVSPFVFGFSVDVGPDGKPRIKRFGNPTPGKDSFMPRPVLEPLVDVIEEDDEIIVVAEVPGVERDEIHVKIKGTTLILDVTNPQRPYHKDIQLPAKVKKDGAKSSIRNGVLEVRLKKA